MGDHPMVVAVLEMCSVGCRVFGDFINVVSGTGKMFT